MSKEQHFRVLQKVLNHEGQPSIAATGLLVSFWSSYYGAMCRLPREWWSHVGDKTPDGYQEVHPHEWYWSGLLNTEGMYLTPSGAVRVRCRSFVPDETVISEWNNRPVCVGREGTSGVHRGAERLYELIARARAQITL